MKNTMSIKWKIFGFLIGFSTLLLLILWLFQVIFLDSFYQFVKIQEIKSAAGSIVKNRSVANIEEIVERVSVANDVCVRVVSVDGDEINDIYSSDILRGCTIHKLPPPLIQRLVTKVTAEDAEPMMYVNRETFFREQTPRIPPQMIQIMPRDSESIIYTSITDINGLKAVVFINGVISPVNATRSTLRYQLYAITGFMLLFSVMLALLIAKHVAKPIVAINDGAKHLSQGHYDIEFKAKGYREINELAQTLNVAANELSKVEALRRELMANVSHDLRTPLTMISGYAEVMRDLPGENTPENAHIIVEEAKRLTSLVNDVLDISRLENGVQELRRERFNLTMAIEDIVARISELLRKDGYLIDFKYSTQAFVSADQIKISQAFYNMLINAVNYTGADKTVRVVQSISEENGKKTVTVSIADSGEGIDEQDIPYIWDRYYKSEKNHKRGVTGTGLGLSIVRRIIENHGGICGVKSMQGQGSVFWFSLDIQ